VKQRTGKAGTQRTDHEPEAALTGVSQRILQLAHSDLPLTSFLRETVQLLWCFLGCDAVELWVQRKDRCLCCEARHAPRRATFAGWQTPRGAAQISWRQTQGKILGEIALWVADQRAAPTGTLVSPAGACWTNDRRRLSGTWPSVAAHAAGKSPKGATEYRSLALLPLDVAGPTIGVLHIKNRRANSLCEAAMARFAALARSLSVALSSQLGHSALRERIKELTCLYRLAQLAERPDVTLEELLQGVAELLPAAWQYPEVTAARLVFGQQSYRTANFGASVHQQWAALLVNGECRGRIEVTYSERRPELDEGPFLKEERALLDAVARQVALLIERRHAAQEKVHLQDQLRHADRLATIGQLAAGVAHELNEPLGNILAFAQLAEKQPCLSSQARQDLERIVAASLYAREIIKKLMLFARQMPPQKAPVNLNGVIEDGLYFLGARCVKSGVVVTRRLARNLPGITADPSQLKQVLVNLVVNALQAMPEGGTLKIATRAAGGQVVWTVEDNGIGMGEDVLQKIFLPFFTTKSVNEGTGLGLPVVHGIVTTHGGTIAVRSTVGRGTRFEVRLPAAQRDEAGSLAGRPEVSP